jgi:uncharacterized protein YbjT (DUF2867 family)
MQSVLIAGATGYLGRFLCATYRSRGYHVTALVRDRRRAADLQADKLIEAEATNPETLCGVMDGIDLVVSALGITRQADGLSYKEVDFGANLNLLREAERAGVKRFAYIHVLKAQAMRHVPLVSAKADFVDALQASGIASTVIAPSGYFSDMGEFLSMARAGRVWLFGSGAKRINPIHGADLAQAVVDATEAGRLARCGWAGGLHPGRDRRAGLRRPGSPRADHAAARRLAQGGAGGSALGHSAPRPRPGAVLPDRSCARYGGSGAWNETVIRAFPAPCWWRGDTLSTR